MRYNASIVPPSEGLKKAFLPLPLSLSSHHIFNFPAPLPPPPPPSKNLIRFLCAQLRVEMSGSERGSDPARQEQRLKAALMACAKRSVDNVSSVRSCAFVHDAYVL